MQITLPQVIDATEPAFSNEINTDVSLQKQSEGEIIKARVVFASANTAHLKTDAGAFIRARIEGDVILSEGKEIYLTIIEKADTTIKLRLEESLSYRNTPSFGPEKLSTLPFAITALLKQLQNLARHSIQKPEVLFRLLSDYPALNLQEEDIQQTLALLAEEKISIAPKEAKFNGANLIAKANPQIGEVLQELKTLLTLETKSTAHIIPSAKENTTATFLAPLFELFMPQQTAQPSTPSHSFLPNLTSQALSLPVSPEILASLLANTVSKTPNNEETAPHIPQESQAALPTKTSPEYLISGNTAINKGEESVQSIKQEYTVVSALTPAERQEALSIISNLVTELYANGDIEPNAQKLCAFIEHLFIKDSKSAQELASKLLFLTQEMQIRLELLERVLERSSLPQKEALLQQTGRLLQQNIILQEQRPLCLQFPLFFAKQPFTAELYIYRRKKAKQTIDPHQATVLLALNTEHLGRLEALIRLRQKDLDIKLEVSRLEAIDFMKKQSPALSTLLAKAGYRLNSAIVQPLTKKTSPQTAEQVLEEFHLRSKHLVDIQV
ncbi:MAG: flagellar hook-length control protein FliK [Firmicutes bacterium]|nr:flagellar hook-length control protein FliK [Bacillota bacterium]